MGKNKRKSQKENIPNGPISSPAKLREMFDKAQDHLSNLELEEALKISQELVSTNPNNADAFELRACVALEMMDEGAAMQYLDRSIELQPFSGYRKYLSKAQLLNGKEALACYQKAIQLIKVEIVKIKPATGASTTTKINITLASEESEAMDVDNSTVASASSSSATDPPLFFMPEKQLHPTRELSCVYCSIAELFFTDLCDEADAEDQCKSAIKLALEADPTNPEAFITKGRYLNIIGELDEARSVMSSSQSLWLSPDDPEEMGPSTKMNLAKLLIELELHDQADEVLLDMKDEDDEIVEVWYLLGWNCFLMGEEHHAQAYEHLRDAIKVERVNSCEDPELLQHIRDLLTQVKPAGHDDSEDPDDDQLEQELMRLIAEMAEDNGEELD